MRKICDFLIYAMYAGRILAITLLGAVFLATIVVATIFIVREYYFYIIHGIASIQSAPESWNSIRLIDLEFRTSHNSYLAQSQQGAKPSVGNIKSAIALGARCLELDIGSDNSGEPIVYHAGLSRGSLKLTEALGAIAESAFTKVDDPILLNLEIYNWQDRTVCDRIYEYALAAFGHRLFVQSKNPAFRELTLGQARGKVFLMTRSAESGSLLRSVMVDWHSWANMSNNDENSKNIQSLDKFHRVFPAKWFSVASLNIDAKPFQQRGFNSIGMNFGGYGPSLLSYLKSFGPYSMRIIR